MLRQRLFSSAILITIVGLCVWLDATRPLRGVDGLWLLPILLSFTIGTSFEMSKLFEAGQLPIRRSLAIGGSLAIVLGVCIPMLCEAFGVMYPIDCPIGHVGWIGVMTFLAIGIGLCVELWSYSPTNLAARGQTVSRLAGSIFIATYVGVPLAFLVLIRAEHSSMRGLMDLVGIVIVTKSADIGAYFAGKLLGRHKLIPRVSPGKTWEGVGGGVLLSIIAAYLWFGMQLIPSIPLPGKMWAPALFGILLAVLGLIGDLSESMVKRDTGQKDSGGLLPGLGGVWDVTDSLIGTSLAAFLMIAAHWIG